jgi:RNA polymerase-binding transcription factor DksA
MNVNVDTEAMRARLEDRMNELIRRTGAVEAHLRGGDGRLDANEEDRVSYTELDDVLEQLDVSGRRELDAIKAALARIADGTYGMCIACGGEIQPGRLALMPETALCRSCAEERQR